MKRIHVISLGCAKNFVDSEGMLGRFAEAGYRIVDAPEEADLLLVNTCGFIQPAVEEAIDEILEAARIKAMRPGVRLVVTGCMVQRYGSQLQAELPEVDLFIGIDDQPRIVALVEGRIPCDPPSIGPSIFLLDHTMPRRLATPSFRAYMKITEGCDNRCTYCMIPSIRGRLRSRSLDDLAMEARWLDDSGVRELSLIAQDLTAYGDDLDPSQNILSLLQRLLADTDIPWIRLLYLYPSSVDEQLLTLMAEEPRIVPYLDIPFQHVSDPVLRRMHRRYGLEDLDRLVTRIRKFLPQCAIRTTFLVGFPGETDADFALLLARVKSWQLDHVGTFIYQDEDGCAAHAFADKIGEDLAVERQRILMEAQAAVSSAKLAGLVGRNLPVLIEGVSRESDLLLEGRLQSQAPDIDGCVYITDGQANPGDVHEVHITEAHTYDLVGEIRRT